MKTVNDNLVLWLLVLGIFFGVTSGCAFPITAVKWYYVAEAAKYVCLSAIAFIFIKGEKETSKPIIFDLALITLGFSINQLLKEVVYANPTETQISDYILLISIVIWFSKKYLAKLSTFCSKVCRFWH